MSSLTTMVRVCGKTMMVALAPLSLAVLMVGCEPNSATREKERVENEAEMQKENIDRRVDAHEDRAEAKKDAIDHNVEATKDQIDAQNDARENNDVPPPGTP